MNKQECQKSFDGKHVIEENILIKHVTLPNGETKYFGQVCIKCGMVGKITYTKHEPEEVDPAFAQEKWNQLTDELDTWWH